MRPELFNIDTAILTSRTLTRRFREGDGGAFFELVQNNHSYIEDHFPKLMKAIVDKNTSEVFIRTKIARWLLQDEYTFGIWDNESTALIGYFNFLKIDWSIPKAEIGYFIDQNHAGKGLMTEVVARMIQYGFLQLKFNKLTLKTLQDNYGSQRLARKVGFRREGDLRHEFQKNSGGLFDVMAFGLTKEEYGG